MTATTPGASSSGQSLDDLLESVNERTPKVKLLEIIRELGRVVHDRRDEKMSRLQALEQKVRDKRASYDYDLRTVMVTGTPDEYRDAIDFLGDFEGEKLLPVMLARLLEGALVVIEEEEDDQS